MGKHGYTLCSAIALLGAVLVLAACTTTLPKGNQTDVKLTGNVVDDSLIEITDVLPEPEPAEAERDEPKPKEELRTSIEIPEQYQDIDVKKYVVEGELVTLAPEAYDPDGDKVVYTFSKPFDKLGKWQTVEGDAGFYPVTIAATDGKLQSSQDVLVVVKPSNKAPVLNCPAEIRASEGETITLDCTAEDKEGDQIIWEYSGWMSQKTKETNFDSAGTYKTHVKVSDGNRASEKDITVVVEHVNRAPVLEELATISVTETETVVLRPKASDPDGDRVTFSFAVPFEDDGTWKTKKGDKGMYEVAVVATDGKLTDNRKVSVTVKKLNTAPVLEFIAPITLDEGDTVVLPIDATDPENDRVIITVSGWMDSDEYTTTYEDAGTHIVIVTASDGFLEMNQNVTINVVNKNRPPVFKIPV